MKPLDRKTLKRFLKLAADRLSGDWVLIGGTVLIALEAEHRSTMDIDIVGLGDRTQADTLRLMELAEELGLPVETINQAGAYFLQKIPEFRRHLISLQQGKRATVFRPDAVLYFRLKLGRLSESDLSDCLAFLKFASVEERKEVRKLVTAELRRSKAGEKNRRARLQALVEKV